MNEQQKPKRTVAGRVVSNSMDKTITVLVERRVRHPLYGKFINRTSKLYAHDESNQCKKDDLVLVEACRPLSKQKCWRLVEVLESAQVV